MQHFADVETAEGNGTHRSRDGLNRRGFLGTATAGAMAAVAGLSRGADAEKKAQIAITFDLEMSRHYPTWDNTEWDYQKGNLDEPTKRYSLEAANVAKKLGGVIHFFLVGRVLEQADIGWLKEIAAAGHAVGNHTYDHVNLLANSPQKAQFRFQRAPWLIAGRTTEDVLRENVRLTTVAMRQRAGITPNGFRTPGGFANGLADRPDLQQMLTDQGFDWVSSKYPRHQSGRTGEPPTQEVYDDIVRAQREAQPFVYPSGLIEIPMSPISDVGAFRSRRWKLTHFLKAVRLAVEWAIETGGVFDFLCHPSCMVVEDPKFQTVRLICDLIQAAGDRAEIVTLDNIAEAVRRRA
ncbi:MAG: polysaccharide deacetylase family protein [Planctomycetota bacterium]